jgi:hypothetical protein
MPKARDHRLPAKKRRQEAARSTLPEESRAAEALTVGWLLAVMTAALCQFGGALAWALRDLGPGAALAMRYFFFAALLIGLMSLVLAGGVFKTRRVPPPRGITIIGLVIGVAPLVVMALMSF